MVLLYCDEKINILQEKVIGFHYLGPNAGEVTQGFGGMLKLGATKEDFDNLIGIHPTTAEVSQVIFIIRDNLFTTFSPQIFTFVTITKSSGMAASAAGC